MPASPISRLLPTILCSLLPLLPPRGGLLLARALLALLAPALLLLILPRSLEDPLMRALGSSLLQPSREALTLLHQQPLPLHLLTTSPALHLGPRLVVVELAVVVVVAIVHLGTIEYIVVRGGAFLA